MSELPEVEDLQMMVQENKPNALLPELLPQGFGPEDRLPEG